MSSHETRFLTVLKNEAWSIACSDASWEAQLCTELDEFFDDNIFLHVVRLNRTGRWSLRVAGWVDSPVRLDGDPPHHDEQIDDFRAHSGIAMMLAQGTSSPIRLSDLLDLPRFRHTAVFHATHSYPTNTRFASAAPLLSTSNQLILLGAHSVKNDFTTEQMNRFVQLQRVLSHALTIRTELQRLADTAGGSPDSPVRISTTAETGETGETGYWPSRREQQVLGLLVLGLTSSQIARRMDITERTVRKHLDSIYRKADLPGRAAAAAWWQRLAS